MREREKSLVFEIGKMSSLQQKQGGIPYAAHKSLRHIQRGIAIGFPPKHRGRANYPREQKRLIVIDHFHERPLHHGREGSVIRRARKPLPAQLFQEFVRKNAEPIKNSPPRSQSGGIHEDEGTHSFGVARGYLYRHPSSEAVPHQTKPFRTRLIRERKHVRGVIRDAEGELRLRALPESAKVREHATKFIFQPLGAK